MLNTTAAVVDTPEAPPYAPGVPEDKPEPTLLMTVEEAAAQLRVSERTIWQLIANRELAVVRFGKRATRVTYQSLVDYVARHEERGGPDT